MTIDRFKTREYGLSGVFDGAGTDKDGCFILCGLHFGLILVFWFDFGEVSEGGGIFGNGGSCGKHVLKISKKYRKCHKKSYDVLSKLSLDNVRLFLNALRESREYKLALEKKLLA